MKAWLETKRLGKFADSLFELGVETMEDFQDLTNDDLTGLGMTKIQRNRLRYVRLPKPPPTPTPSPVKQPQPAPTPAVVPTPAPPKKYEVVFTVPPGAAPGDIVSCDLPHGEPATAAVPDGRHPGDSFSAFWPPVAAGDGSHLCEVCGRLFKSAFHLRLHSNTHTRSTNAVKAPERHRIVPHPSCIRISEVRHVDPEPVAPHRRPVEAPFDPDEHRDHLCAICKRGFKSRIALEVHRSRMSCAPPSRYLKQAKRRFWLDDDDPPPNSNQPRPSTFSNAGAHLIRATPGADLNADLS